MASAGIVGELNAQLEKRNKTNSSDAAAITVDENRTEQRNGESCEGSTKKKSKGGIFSKFKKLVKKPGQKKQNADKSTKENGELERKRRTKSTSDLTESGEEDKTASPKHSSKQKPGISLFFGRKLKGRSSLKSKGKNDGSSSQPVSPEQKARAYTSPVRTIDKKEREELETINKTIADDSFFQISLTNQSLDTSVQSGVQAQLGDFDVVSEPSPGIGAQKAAQDRIRLAPKGRRKPTRFNSKTDATEKGAAKKDKDKEVPNVDRKGIEEGADKHKTSEKPALTERPGKAAVAEKIERPKKPEVAQKPQVSIKGGSSKRAEEETKIDEVQGTTESVDGIASLPKVVVEKPASSIETEKPPGLDLSAVDDAKSVDLSDIVIIKTPTVSRNEQEGGESSNLESREFGSWEHLPGARSLQQSDVSSSGGDSSDEKPKKEDIKVPEVRESSDRKKTTAESSRNEEKVKNTDEDKGQRILDLIEGKTKASTNICDKAEADIEKSPKSSVVLMGIKDKGEDGVGQEPEKSTAFDALISRTRHVSDGQQIKYTGSHEELKITAESNEAEKSSKLNWSFDLQETDDIRSNDLQPMTFQRSHSMSAPMKGCSLADSILADDSHPELMKWKSMDDSMTQHDKTLEMQVKHSTENGNVPQWIAIAKEKHMRHASMEEDEEDQATLEETMEEIKDIAAQIANPREKYPALPSTKDKPSSTTSKIPKPAFKSQSMKLQNTSTTAATKLQPRTSVTSKVSSPVSSCIVCSKPAYQFERCDVDGKVIHKNCARCSMCSRTMNVGTIRVVNEKLYCGIHARAAMA